MNTPVPAATQAPVARAAATHSVGRYAWLAIFIASLLVVLATARYIPLGGDAAPAELQPHLADRPLSFFVHISGAAVALLCGPWQYLMGIRRRWTVHRWLGRLYVAGCLVGGITALPLAANSPLGALAGSGFFLLGLFWLATTIIGLASIRRHDMAAHRRWMLRSLALTLAAPMQRLILSTGLAFGFDFIDVYIASAWLCWLTNLAIVEIFLRKRAGRAVAESRWEATGGARRTVA